MNATRSSVASAATLLACALVLTACGDDSAASAPSLAAPPSSASPSTDNPPSAPGSSTPSASAADSPTAGGSPGPTSPAPAPSAPAVTAGNPAGRAPVPADAAPVDTSHPDRTVGTGSPAGCTSQAVVDAVAAGGIITFSCGPAPVTITLTRTARVRNASARVVLDGGGRVTLSGGGARRILYLNTCDQQQGWTTSHCQDQASPELTVQHLTFADGNASGQSADGGGGGAIFVRGGRLRVIDSRFVRNRCDQAGQDVGGGAVRVLDQYHGLPVIVSGSTFGGADGEGNSCSNGGALSSIGVSWTIRNSVLSGNTATGRGANPARPGTPGGGNGGALCTDGNHYAVDIAGSVVNGNLAHEGGGGLFFVSNDRTGTLRTATTTLTGNTSEGFETPGHPGIFFQGAGSPRTS
ncbi:hypothetical protein K353_05236 [Kitasatospora sp. SolWspMP-SS2h]|uniref:hypothetical protein n=1 Tax=Kitasatospora sp. SolWspMP-SS2h TaxID=1305729 RepID=UPI000DBF5FB6|nr:hypothetical protein [Kitasatospora sp. SolWspMP-SS2h]RAJ34590.1 hypothetical protein K353_05236 [Kitasatospora sp. SolWspMP-SS2h]